MFAVSELVIISLIVFMFFGVMCVLLAVMWDSSSCREIKPESTELVSSEGAGKDAIKQKQGFLSAWEIDAFEEGDNQ